MFLNYCTRLLVIGFAYFWKDFSRSRSSDLRHFAKKKKKNLKDFRIQTKTLVPESSFKVAEFFNKETLAQVFLCIFHKIKKKKCFVAAMFCRTFKKILPKYIFYYHPIPVKKVNRRREGGVKPWNLKGYWKKQLESLESIKIEVYFLGVIMKKSCGFSIGLRFWSCNFQGVRACFLRVKWQYINSKGFFQKCIYTINPPLWSFSVTAQYSWKEAGSASHACPQQAYQDQT